MSKNLSANERWILNQLMGIRSLEEEVASALRKPSGNGTQRIRRRINELNSWLDAVDHSLSARSPRRSR